LERRRWDSRLKLMLDVMPRYVDSLHAPAGHVPRYTTMDARLAWQPTRRLELAVVGQNLLDAHHLEYFGLDSVATEVDRGVYGSLRCQF
jgi:iron complex outermembrane receptor protein